jgi:hypothetical protein
MLWHCASHKKVRCLNPAPILTLSLSWSRLADGTFEPVDITLYEPAEKLDS